MKFHSRRRVSPVITIVSLVDILTMVLMFFVYTTTFKTNVPQVEIVLPQVEAAGEKPSEAAAAFLTISKTGDIYLDEKEVSLDALGEAVKQAAAKNRRLALRAHEEAPFGLIMKVLDKLKGVGVKDLPAFTRGSK